MARVVQSIGPLVRELRIAFIAEGRYSWAFALPECCGSESPSGLASAFDEPNRHSFNADLPQGLGPAREGGWIALRRAGYKRRDSC